MADTKDKWPIAWVFPRGEAIRNFAYGGALEVVAKARRCGILSVKPSEDVWQNLAGRCWAIETLEEYPERYPVRLLRDLLDLAHGRWLWSEAAKERWRLRDTEARTVRKRLKRWGKKLAVTPLSNRTGIGLLMQLERIASRRMNPTTKYDNLLRNWRPALLFNASHVHSRNAIQAVQSAQWQGIRTATFVFSWDNLTSQGRVHPCYDHYLVWTDSIKKQLMDIYPGVDPTRVTVTGTPQFDPHFNQSNWWTREEFCRRVGADPRRPIVLYATGMPNHMPGEERLVEAIANILAEFPELKRPQLLVRVYAKDLTGRFDELKRRRQDILFPPVPWEVNWLTPLPEDLPLWTNTLRHCTVGINVASTVSLELCMFDKPVINVAFNPPGVAESDLNYARYYQFDHYSPVVASGAVELARSLAELRQLIHSALELPELRRAERRGLLKTMFGNGLDGRASERVAAALLRLAEPE